MKSAKPSLSFKSLDFLKTWQQNIGTHRLREIAVEYQMILKELPSTHSAVFS